MRSKNPQIIIDAISRINGVKPANLFKDKTRSRELSNIRAMVITALRERAGFSYRQIGKILNREHSSVRRLYKRGIKKPAVIELDIKDFKV